MTIKALSAATLLRALVAASTLGGVAVLATPAAATLTASQQSALVSAIEAAATSAQTNTQNSPVCATPGQACDNAIYQAVRAAVATAILTSGATPLEASAAITAARADLTRRGVNLSNPTLLALSDILQT